MPGITDIRFAEDEGVAVPRPPLFPGDLAASDADLECSGVLTLTDKFAWPCLEGGCSDLVFAALDAVKPRAPSV